MKKLKRPRIAWALYCGKAERDAGNFVNITKVFQAVPVIPNPDIGVDFCLVFGIDGVPHSKFTLHLTVVQPTGLSEKLEPMNLELALAGIYEGIVEITSMPLAEIGDHRTEFRFDGEKDPSYVAILRVIAPTTPDLSSKTH